MFIHVIRLALERDKRTDEHANIITIELGIESDVVIRCSIYSTVACGCETDNWLVACMTNQKKKKKGIPRIIISAMTGYMNNAILCKRILIYLFVVVKRLIMLMFMIVVMMLNWLN